MLCLLRSIIVFLKVKYRKTKIQNNTIFQNFKRLNLSLNALCHPVA